jgi:hypothetical protein
MEDKVSFKNMKIITSFLVVLAVSLIVVGCKLSPVHIVLNNVTQPAVDKPYSYFVKTIGGSGKYAFSVSAGQLPEGLSLNSATGEISGTITEETDWVTFTITTMDAGVAAKDTTSDSRQIELKSIVTPFNPDQWEPLDDNFDTTANIMAPGDPAQYHTIDVLDDTDIIKIDLRNVPVGAVVKIETYPVSYDTDVYMYLYRNQYTNDPVGYGDDESIGKQAKILYTVGKSEIHYIQISARGTGYMQGLGFGIGEYTVDVQMAQ